jgi:hypothetical protein
MASDPFRNAGVDNLAWPQKAPQAGSKTPSVQIPLAGLESEVDFPIGAPQRRSPSESGRLRSAPYSSSQRVTNAAGQPEMTFDVGKSVPYLLSAPIPLPSEHGPMASVHGDLDELPVKGRAIHVRQI